MISNSQHQLILEEIETNKATDMGERWNEQELDIFLKYFKETGLDQLDEIQQELQENGFNRSIYNLISLYYKNRNTLKYNKQIEGKVLSAILDDYYESMPQPIQPQQQQQQQQQQQSEQKVKENKDAYNMFSSNKKKKLQKSKGSVELFKTDKGENRNSDIELFQGGSRVKRKVNLQKGENFINQENDAESRINFLEASLRNCNGKNPRKINKRNLDGPTSYYVRYIEHEYFYSHIDKPYFEYNEFKHMLNEAGLENIEKLSKKEWYLIRKAMGKPRRFSKAFLEQERKKLNKYRELIRKYLYEPHSLQIENVIKNEYIVNEVKKLSSFQVGQFLMAIHPICGHFHQGSVLTCNGPSIIIKFFTNELGVHKVSDNKLSLEHVNILMQQQQSNNQIQDRPASSQMEIEPQSYSNINTSQQQQGRKDKESVNSNHVYSQETKNLSQQSIIQDLDINSMAFLIKVLDRKTFLINQLKEFNDFAEQNPEALNDQFYQEYGWTGVQINLLDDALRHIITKFRLRGLKNFDNIGQISGNLGKILQTPLNYIENQLEVQGNSVQQNTLQQIKTIHNKSMEEKLVQQIGDLIDEIEQEIYREKFQNNTNISENQENGKEVEKEEVEDKNNIQEEKQDQDLQQEKEQQQEQDQNKEQEQEQQDQNIEQEQQQDQNNEQIVEEKNEQINEQEDQNNQQEEEQKEKIQDSNEEKGNAEQNDQNNNNNAQQNSEKEVQQEQTQMEEEIDQNQEKQETNNNTNSLNENQEENIVVNEEQQNVQVNEEEQNQEIQDNNTEEQKQKQQEQLDILQRLISDDEGEKEKLELRNLTLSCMGVLMTLKNEGEIDITQSKFIQDVSQQCYEDHQEQFFELQNTILNLNTKNK